MRRARSRDRGRLATEDERRKARQESAASAVWQLIRSGSMSALLKPSVRPRCPNFSSGPCAKRPGWSYAALAGAALGRSHRAKIGKDKLKQVIDETKALLELPPDYLVGIVAGSDTGAVEAALWSLL